MLRITKAMDRNTRACLKELRDLGCPLFMHDEDPQEYGMEFFMSAEGNDLAWADYYPTSTPHRDAPGPWISPQVEQIVSDHNMAISWISPGYLGIYRD